MAFRVAPLGLLLLLGRPPHALAQEASPSEPSESPVLPAPQLPTGSADSAGGERESVDPSTADWWQPTAGGLTAMQAARRALDSAPAIAGANAARAEAEAIAARALSAFLPQVSVTGSYARLSEVDLPPFEIPGLPPTDNPFPQILDVFRLQGTATLPISDYFFAILPAYQGASGFAEAASLQSEVARRDVGLRAQETFYGYARALGAHAVMQQTLESLGSTTEDLTRMHAAGLTSRADLAQMRAALASARAAEIGARGRVRLAARALMQIMHAEEDTFEIGEDLRQRPEAPESLDEGTLIDQARHNRAEVRALRRMIEARNALLRARYGAMLPHLVVTGQFDTASPNQRVFPQTTDIVTTWALGVGLSWSPDAAVAAAADARQAQAQIEQAQAQLQQLEEGLTLAVVQALVSYQSASESVGASVEAVEAAELGHSDRQALLAVGRATATEVLQSQTALAQARIQYLDAIVLFRIATARIAHALGEGPS